MIKFPSLFGRTPKHQKFSFEPRFYDPIKDELKERENRIRQEMENEKNKTIEGYKTRIHGSFHSARKRSSASQADLQAAVMRIAILLVLVVILVAYLQWGSVALYGLLIVIPVYAWLRFRR
jgi:type IV secretory pathway VirB6-like protein